MEVAVWRGDASGGSFVRYAVPRLESQTVLDVVTWIQRNVASTLTYRFSCRVGMCGSCAMMVNGAPRWTCRTHVQKVLRRNCIEIAPLRNLPVIKDLAVDMAEFFDKWMAAEGRFHSLATRHDDIAPVRPDSIRRRAAARFAMRHAMSWKKTPGISVRPPSTARGPLQTTNAIAATWRGCVLSPATRDVTTATRSRVARPIARTISTRRCRLPG